MRNLFIDYPRQNWQNRMRAASARLCCNLLTDVFTCGTGCFRVSDIEFDPPHKADGTRGRLLIWLRPIGGMAHDHQNRPAWDCDRQRVGIYLRDFLKHYRTC